MILDIKRLPEITIGHETDNLTNTIEIDVRPWKRNNPGLDSWDIVVHSPNGDTYLASEVVEHDGILSWVITDSDTAYPGKGTYEVVAKGANGESISSGPVKMRVADRTKGTASETPPEAAQGWVDKVLDAAQRAEAAAERAEEGGGMPSGATANQWLVSDSDAVVKWEEKPFYKETGTGFVLEETTASVVDGTAAMGTFIKPVEVGTEYTVNWNGTEYKCVCQEPSESDSPDVVFMGNGTAVGGDDSGEPFVLLMTRTGSADDTLLAGNACIAAPLDGSEVVTVSIIGPVEVVHSIDPEYLGSMRGQKKIVINLDEMTCSIPFSEAWLMDAAELQASAVVIYMECEHAICGIRKYNEGDILDTIVITINTSISVDDYAARTEVRFSWYPAGIGNVHAPMILGDDFNPVRDEPIFWAFDVEQNGPSWQRINDFALPSITLKSPNGTHFAVTVDDEGNLSAKAKG